jgi:hypothetical protein
MKSRTRKWLLGCGVPVVAAIVVVVALILGGSLYLKSAVEEFEEFEDSLDDLTARLGPAAEFRASPDGAISADRIEAFLAARERVAEARADVDESLIVLSGDRGGVIAQTRAVAALVPQIANFLRDRNVALMENEVSLGEYHYLYTLAFYSWLGASPEDGPSFRMVNDRGIVFETIENIEEPEVRRHRNDVTRRSMNRMILPVLRDQLAAVTAEKPPADLESWIGALENEIAAMESDPLRLPWQDGLPQVISQSLAPYRARLEASYSEASNALEAGIARRSLPSGGHADDVLM